MKVHILGVDLAKMSSSYTVSTAKDARYWHVGSGVISC